jgi:hypothetical protein
MATTWTASAGTPSSLIRPVIEPNEVPKVASG